MHPENYKRTTVLAAFLANVCFARAQPPPKTAADVDASTAPRVAQDSLEMLAVDLAPTYQRSEIENLVRDEMRLWDASEAQWGVGVTAVAKFVRSRVVAAAPKKPRFRLVGLPVNGPMLIEDLGEGQDCRRTFLLLSYPESRAPIIVESQVSTCCTPLDCKNPSPLSTVAKFIDAAHTKDWKTVAKLAPPTGAMEINWAGTCPVAVEDEAACPERTRHARITRRSVPKKARNILPPVNIEDVPDFQCPESFDGDSPVSCCASVPMDDVCFRLRTFDGEPAIIGISTNDWTH